MKNERMVMRVSVDEESILGRIASIERMADALRLEAMCLRDAITVSQAVDKVEEEPEA